MKRITKPSPRRSPPPGRATPSSCWFGGEPLLNVEAIRTICGMLAAAGISYGSQITTNGYLFGKDMAREAAGEWNTHSVQITLDGTERTYNRVKAYVGLRRGESPYHRVLQNIGWLLDEGVRVSVRLNVGSHNLEDLCDLVGELANLYAGRDGFCAYAYPIKDSNGRSYIAMDDRSMKEDYFKLLDLLDEAGIGVSDSLGDPYRISRCMADHRDCVTVLPDGRFGRCEHYSEGEDMVGSVFTEGLDQEVLRRWTDIVRIPECAECVLYPRCRRLALCPWVNGSCRSTDRGFELRVLHRKMIKAYNAYSRRSEVSS